MNPHRLLTFLLLFALAGVGCAHALAPLPIPVTVQAPPALRLDHVRLVATPTGCALVGSTHHAAGTGPATVEVVFQDANGAELGRRSSLLPGRRPGWHGSHPPLSAFRLELGALPASAASVTLRVAAPTS